jgi:serine/threonine protein kinase
LKFFMFPFGQVKFQFQAPPPYGNPGLAVTDRAGFPSPSTQRHECDSDISVFCKEFEYGELNTATNGFSQSNVIGSGTFGAVYRGILSDLTEVAVKLISNPTASGFDEEIRILSKYRHPNLITLLGFARRGRERLLVYEFMSGGDCERLLRGGLSVPPFTWRQRLSVLLDTCRGLAFLANSNPIAFHRDIKPSNMLLSIQGAARMADFGLACELESKGKTSLQLRTSAGTIGYACQHYVQSGIVSEATEVFSFGICILEFLTNQPPAVQSNHVTNQVVYLVDSLQENMQHLLRILDPRAGWPEQVAFQLGNLVFYCTQRQIDQRPSFVTIVKRIKHICDSSVDMENRPHHNQLAATRPGLGLPVGPLPLPNYSQSAQPDGLHTQRGEIGSQEYVLSFSPSADPSRAVSVKFLRESRELVIGRNRQTEAIAFLSERLKLCVSREHFSIRRLPDGSLTITNLSGNGVVVNDTFLEEKGDSCPVSDGSIIKLVQTDSYGIQSPFLLIGLHLAR